MLEITAVGMGLMMTVLAVVVGGLLLEGTLLLMCTSLRTATVTASLEPAVILSEWVE